jgi:hypothetical protein
MADATDQTALAADLRAWAGRLDRYRRFYDAGPGELGEPGVDTLRLAADTLDRLAVRVAELEAGLRPFAPAGRAMLTGFDPGSGPRTTDYIHAAELLAPKGGEAGA